jgi:hypothetical protein
MALEFRGLALSVAGESFTACSLAGTGVPTIWPAENKVPMSKAG